VSITPLCSWSRLRENGNANGVVVKTARGAESALLITRSGLADGASGPSLHSHIGGGWMQGKGSVVMAFLPPFHCPLRCTCSYTADLPSFRYEVFPSHAVEHLCAALTAAPGAFPFLPLVQAHFRFGVARLRELLCFMS
jgi:hypothetical protein